MKFQDVFYVKNATMDQVYNFAKEVHQKLINTDLILEVDKLAILPHKNGARILVNADNNAVRSAMLAGLCALQVETNKSDINFYYNEGNDKINVTVATENGIVINKSTYRKSIAPLVRTCKLIEEMNKGMSDRERDEQRVFLKNAGSFEDLSSMSINNYLTSAFLGLTSIMDEEDNKINNIQDFIEILDENSKHNIVYKDLDEEKINVL